MPGVPKTFVGFGFGPIQAGLFLYEAFRAARFERLVVAEIAPALVDAIRRAGGRYRINIAKPGGIEVQEVGGVEVFNPQAPADAESLRTALAQASEICTALPSVEFYTKGKPSVASLLTDAIARKTGDRRLPACILYTAENHNHAAEILEAECESGIAQRDRQAAGRPAQFLNTVIGKMSGVVTHPGEIQAEGLAGLVDGVSHAFLVEEFNRILISKVTLPGFQRSIPVFVEKPDLLPFEEAKLYGHNAVHALIGYLAHRRGFRFMSEAAGQPELLSLAREAFLLESGQTLIARHPDFDPLFTPGGYQAYADDLLARMTNPYLRDRVDRVIRDPRRKLAWNDRFIGAMRLALDAGLHPNRLALGAAAALESLGQFAAPAPLPDPLGLGPAAPAHPEPGTSNPLLRWDELWPEPDEPPGRKSQLIELIRQARIQLRKDRF